MQIIKRKNIAVLLAAPQQQQIEPAPKPRTQIMETSAPILDTNFPPPMKAASANLYHRDRYYFDAMENKWFLVVDAKTERSISTWTLCEVDSKTGKPIGINRQTQVDLWGDRFADHPFDVRAYLDGELEEKFAWFGSNFAANKDIVCQMELFDAYCDRLRYHSSHAALVRLGLTE